MRVCLRSMPATYFLRARAVAPGAVADLDELARLLQLAIGATTQSR